MCTLDNSRFDADYTIETALNPHEAAGAMAGGQSSGTFVALPGAPPDLKERPVARIEALELIDEVSERWLGKAARRR